jgi:hypothetical protein
MTKVYYIDAKASPAGFELTLKTIKIRKIINNKVNGKVFVNCCFKTPEEALILLMDAVNSMKEDTTTKLIEAFHNKE